MAATARVEIRLDPEHKQLDELVTHREATVSVVLRDLIDAAYEEIALQRREAVQRIFALGESEDAEEMPDPEELKRQLGSMFEGPLPGFHDYGPVDDDISPVTAQKRSR